MNKNVFENRRGIPKQLKSVVKATYTLRQDRVSKEFKVASGVANVCILSSILFLPATRDICRASLATMDELSFIKFLNYAIDICLLSHRITDLDLKALDSQWEANRVRLNADTNKTSLTDHRTFR